mgnify:CR=1 FL=1
MKWKDLTRLQRLESGLDAYVWNGQSEANQNQLLKNVNKRLKLGKEVGSITTVKENPEQRATRKDKRAKAQALRKSQTPKQRAKSAFDDLENDIAKARKDKPKASGGSVKNYAYGGRVAAMSAEKS